MKRIQVGGHNKVKGVKRITAWALVDDEDFEWLNQWKWSMSSGGYVYRGINKQSYKAILMHRLLLNVPQGMFTDHINNIRTDNRRKNLRIVTPAQNSRNSLPCKNSTSKYKGVCKVWSRKNPWQVAIVKNKQTINIGRFKTEIEAAKAYDVKAKELFGEYAYLNFKELTT